MTDAGFFRGTSADQDNRFADKQKKLLKELNYSPVLNTKLNMSKIDLEGLKPWIETKIKEILEKDDDEYLPDTIYEHLAGKEPDGKSLLVLLTGYVEEDSKASKFMEELWTKLIDIQQNSNGLSPKTNATASPENGLSGDTQKTNVQTHIDPPTNETSDSVKASTGDDKKQDTSAEGERKSRSRSRTPQPKQSDSKSRSRSRSRSPQHSGSKSASKSRSRSKSGSRSHSRSRSSSRRRSSSRSRSRSRSSSKSRHSRSRSRSPHYRSNRFRRSRSRSGSFRSPRGRRGYAPRGSYRGGFSYQDRRRGGGPVGPPRGRRMMSPPWSRRRSPPPYRRRRSPSRSPRRRSRSPLYRTMRSRSRSPAYGHIMGRRSPRGHGFAGGPPMGPMIGRHMPPHDIHRPVMTSRSPRGPPMDYARGYGDPSTLPGHSPGHLMGRSHDLPPMSHGLGSGPPRPSGSGAYSPRSPSTERKRHKKDKKHRKHKKSKKRHSSSSSPERRKKHKKHKKSKKHKS